MQRFKLEMDSSRQTVLFHHKCLHFVLSFHYPAQLFFLILVMKKKSYFALTQCRDESRNQIYPM